MEVPLTAYGRVLKGLELYLQCKRIAKTCVIITSGGDPVRTGVSEARVYADELLRAGVDPVALPDLQPVGFERRGREPEG